MREFYVLYLMDAHFDKRDCEEYWNDPTLNCTWENLNMNDLDLVKTRPIRFRLSDITACDLYSVAHIKYHELKTVSNMHASYIIQNADKVNCTIPGFKSFAHAMPFIKNELELDDSVLRVPLRKALLDCGCVSVNQQQITLPNAVIERIAQKRLIRNTGVQGRQSRQGRGTNPWRTAT